MVRSGVDIGARLQAEKDKQQWIEDLRKCSLFAYQLQQIMLVFSLMSLASGKY
jgi:hypothetical protein